MQLRIALDAQFRPYIEINDRGAWVLRNDPAGPAILEGFGGENVVTIHLMSMQSMKTSLHVVHAAVDDHIQSASRTTSFYKMRELSAELNALLREVIDYPDVLLTR